MECKKIKDPIEIGAYHFSKMNVTIMLCIDGCRDEAYRRYRNKF